MYFLNNLKQQAYIEGPLWLKGYSLQQLEKPGPLDINQSAKGIQPCSNKVRGKARLQEEADFQLTTYRWLASRGLLVISNLNSWNTEWDTKGESRPAPRPTAAQRQLGHVLWAKWQPPQPWSPIHFNLSQSQEGCWTRHIIIKKPRGKEMQIAKGPPLKAPKLSVNPHYFRYILFRTQKSILKALL